MTFTQLSFLSAFLPLFLLAGILTRGKRISPNFHIASGLIFLLLWGVVPAAIFVGFIALNALVMGLKGKTRVIWAVLLNLGFIALYKLLPFWGRESWSFHVPLGISYAALQALSFHINQEKGSVVQLAHYLLFLPKLPMGPITAYQDFVNQPQERAERLEDLYQGLCRIILGLSKKLLVTDRLALLTQTLKTAAPQDQGIALAVLAALIFPLQLYLDFSGYTDIALGMARTVGYRLPENFRQPFRAESLRDFWRRWHQSLTNWIGRYVYIPLGGSRRGTARTAMNTVIVYVLIALWHGVSAGFLLWGLWNALLILLERRQFIQPARWPKALRRVYVYMSAVVGFAFFMMAGTGPAGFSAFTKLGTPALALAQLRPGVVLAVALAVLIVLLEGRGLMQRLPKFARHTALLILLALCLLATAGGSHLPFLYAAF